MIKINFQTIIIAICLLCPSIGFAEQEDPYHRLTFSVVDQQEKSYVVAYHYGQMKDGHCIYPLPPIVTISKIKDGDVLDFGPELEELLEQRINCFKVLVVSKDYPDEPWEDSFQWFRTSSGQLVADPRETHLDLK